MSVPESVPNQPPDEDLVRQVLAAPGTRAAGSAAGELFRRYQDRLYLWCYRFVRDHERAVDLVQEVMLTAYRALEGFEGRARFSTWLYTITRNRCLREVRPASLLQDDEIDLEELPAEAGTPEALLEQHQGEEALLRLLRETLDPREQKAIWLRCEEGLGVDEITEILQAHEASGARAILQSARRKLRVALEKRRLREKGLAT